MYITSSTADVMYGGLEDDGGEVSDRERSDGDSSSWKAFSTERRQKKVVMVLKGLTSRSWTFWNNAELVMTGGSVRGGGGHSVSAKPSGSGG
jgi:hypothetical protein